MLFNSLGFLIFFPIVTILFFLLPHRFRWLMLLIASCYFYMSFIPVYILVLALLIIIDYTMGILIEKSQGRKRKLFLLISILATCLVLFVFKYFNFFNFNVAKLATFLHWNYSLKLLSLALPIGLSFHTFQSLSYVIEVYLRRQKAERNFGIYALYVMFYPQLVAGPIERPYNLLHQFYERHYFDYDRVTDGLKLMLWGFFKKLVIADRLALLVNTVYADPTNYNGVPLMLATVFFAFQIYCDFSGYCDIAIGAAQVMGFKLMDNFNRPYSAKSIAEFWRRWHISLSTWFKDYVYIPLGGNRVSSKRLYFNLMVVFLVSGAWHGANWTFAIWGLLHGSYMVISIMTENFRTKLAQKTKLSNFPKIHNVIKILITFILVCISWIFFRADNLTDAIYILTHLFSNLDFNIFAVNSGLGMGLGKIDLAIAFISILLLEFIHLIQSHKKIRREFLTNLPTFIRWLIYLVIVLAVILFGEFGKLEFIYFQF